jgi:hypothetical protein
MKFVNQLLQQHFARYPQMRLEDIYKLLHQAALGPGHALGDPEQARVRLEQEAAALGNGPDEPLRDVISPDGRLARVHLRAYVNSGASLDDLCRAFVATAADYPASLDKLGKFCGCLGDLAAAGGIPFAQQDVIRFFEQIAKSGYPAIHHSPQFSSAYKPAYRVIAIDLLKS